MNSSEQHHAIQASSNSCGLEIPRLDRYPPEYPDSRSAFDTLDEAYRTSERVFGGQETLVSAVTMIITNAIRRKHTEFCCNLLRANADLLEALLPETTPSHVEYTTTVNGAKAHEELRS